MRALLINVGHGHLSSDNHPRHNVAPMDLAQCAAILERAGWRVELWDTVLEHDEEGPIIERRVQAKQPDLSKLRSMFSSEKFCRAFGNALVFDHREDNSVGGGHSAQVSPSSFHLFALSHALLLTANLSLLLFASCCQHTFNSGAKE